MSDIPEDVLGPLCDHIVERRGAYSYMDVARAMCVQRDRREGRLAARQLAERLEISPQTLWNWLNRDLPSWVEKMWATREPAKMGVEVGYVPRGRRISRDDLVMIAGLIRGKSRRPTSRDLRSDIRSLALREPGWGHLKQISHSFLHRKRHELNRLVAAAESEEYYRKRAERDAAAAAETSVAPSVSGEVTKIEPREKVKFKPGEVTFDEV